MALVWAALKMADESHRTRNIHSTGGAQYFAVTCILYDALSGRAFATPDDFRNRLRAAEKVGNARPRRAPVRDEPRGSFLQESDQRKTSQRRCTTFVVSGMQSLRAGWLVSKELTQPGLRRLPNICATTGRDSRRRFSAARKWPSSFQRPTCTYGTAIAPGTPISASVTRQDGEILRPA